MSLGFAFKLRTDLTGRSRMRLCVLLMVAGLCAIGLSARAGEAPTEIRVGTLYASSGRFASISMPVHYGLKLWIEEKNAEGGVYVKALRSLLRLPRLTL
jgi:ABC-type branched-subunit amino acid transport system substrate-binding protein